MDFDFGFATNGFEAKTSAFCKELRRRPRRSKRDWQTPIWKAKAKAKEYDPEFAVERAGRACLARMELNLYGRILNKRAAISLYERGQAMKMKKTLGNKLKAKLAKFVFTAGD